jgi:hypothetical protein
MKKLLLVLALAVSFSLSNAQVFNTGKTLKKDVFSLGIEPVFYSDAGGFMLFLHGGYGIKSGIDLGIMAGFLNGEYIGANLEWGLGKHLSLTTGAHMYGDFGLDGTLNITFPIRHDSRIFTGFDADILFPDGDVLLPLWIPVGVELGLRDNMSFILEGEIPLTSAAYLIFGGGINLYF